MVASNLYALASAFFSASAIHYQQEESADADESSNVAVAESAAAAVDWSYATTAAVFCFLSFAVSVSTCAAIYYRKMHTHSKFNADLNASTAGVLLSTVFYHILSETQTHLLRVMAELGVAPEHTLRISYTLLFGGYAGVLCCEYAVFSYQLSSRDGFRKGRRQAVRARRGGGGGGGGSAGELSSSASSSSSSQSLHWRPRVLEEEEKEEEEEEEESIELRRMQPCTVRPQPTTPVDAEQYEVETRNPASESGGGGGGGGAVKEHGRRMSRRLASGMKIVLYCSLCIHSLAAGIGTSFHHTSRLSMVLLVLSYLIDKTTDTVIIANALLQLGTGRTLYFACSFLFAFATPLGIALGTYLRIQLPTVDRGSKTLAVVALLQMFVGGILLQTSLSTMTAELHPTTFTLRKFALFCFFYFTIAFTTYTQ
jgi:hypothetical protein